MKLFINESLKSTVSYLWDGLIQILFSLKGDIFSLIMENKYLLEIVLQ